MLFFIIFRYGKDIKTIFDLIGDFSKKSIFGGKGGPRQKNLLFFSKKKFFFNLFFWIPIAKNGGKTEILRKKRIPSYSLHLPLQKGTKKQA